MVFERWRLSRRSGLGILACVLFICIAGLIFLVSYYPFFRNASSITPPVYEEIYTSKPGFQEKIKEIDYAIYDVFYRNGISEQDVSFQDVEPRRVNGYAWDFAELRVMCRNIRSAEEIVISLSRKLSELGKGVDFRKQAVSKSGIICQIFANGYHTHRIFLEFNGRDLETRHGRPKVAIIIDDLGYDRNIASAFMELDIPFTFSVFPIAPFTNSIVKMARKRGEEIMVHLPMEPKHYPSLNPGPGALLLSMSKDQIMHTLEQDLRKIPLAQGVNNHMGSAFTENGAKMLIILKQLKKRHLFYIDSRTTSETVGFKLAKKIGLPTAERNVFLDNKLDLKAIRIQVERLLSLARHKGVAIGIAHPYKETLTVLKEYQTRITTEFRAVYASDVVS